MNNQSLEFYNQQPGEFFRGGIYSSQEFHDKNISKTMCPSKKPKTIDNEEICKNYLLQTMGMLPPSDEYKKHIENSDND